MGCAFICREAVIGGGNFSIISFMLAWTFLSLQIKEFHTLAFYINDSIFGSVFFFLTGLHFFHVIVGIILIGIILCIFPLTIPTVYIPGEGWFHFYNINLLVIYFQLLLSLYYHLGHAAAYQ